jgi:hypothetical protein
MIPTLTDGRQLGVAVAELSVDGISVDLHGTAFGNGFYPVERHEQLGWRWTDGAAELNLASGRPEVIEVSIIMVAPSWKCPVPNLREAA